MTWRRAAWYGIGAFVISRMCVLAGAGVRAAQLVVDAEEAGLPRPKNAVGFITEVLSSWDGRWYLEIVRHGYPHSIPSNITYEQAEARAAFFPVYPMVVRVGRRDRAGRRHPRGVVRQLRARCRRAMLLIGRLALRLTDDADGRGTGDGALCRLPGIVRAVVRLCRGGADRAVRRPACCCCSTSAGCWPASSAPSRPRRDPTASRSSPPAPSPRSSPFGNDATGCRSPHRCSVRSASSRSSCASDITPTSRGLVPCAERGVGRGHQLRADRDPQHVQLPRQSARQPDQRAHRGDDDRHGGRDLVRAGGGHCRSRCWPTSS